MTDTLTQVADTVAVALVASLALAGSLGAFWMIWAGARRNNFLAEALRASFVPFSFIWYYERRATAIEKRHLVRVMRIALTLVWTGAGVMFITRGGFLRIVGVLLVASCFYVSNLVSKRERDVVRQR